MEKSEQKLFVKDLMNNVFEDIEKKINDGCIPDNWDGIELRWYLKDRFEWNSTYYNKTKRQKEYKNDLIVLDL